MTKKRELNNESLDKVNGGTSANDFYKLVYGDVIDPNNYSDNVGAEVAVLYKQGVLVCVGNLIEFCDLPQGCSNRKYVRIQGSNDYSSNSQFCSHEGNGVLKACIDDTSHMKVYKVIGHK